MGVTQAEAAYGILENAGMLYRYTGNYCYIDDIDSNVEFLVESAVNYVDGMTIVENIEKIVSSEEFSDFDLNDAEVLIEARDGLEVVKVVLAKILKPWVYAENSRFIDMLDKVDICALRFDKAIAKDKALLTVATRKIACLKDHIKVELAEKDFWWFFEARILDKEMISSEEEIAFSIADSMKQISNKTAGKKKQIILFALPSSGKQKAKQNALFQKVTSYAEKEPDIVFAAGSGDYARVGEFSGEYKDIPFQIRCFKNKTGNLSIEVTGGDGNEISEFENATCVLLKEDKKITSCIIAGGMGLCNPDSDFDKIAVVIASIDAR